MRPTARLLLIAVISASAYACIAGTAAAIPLPATGWNPEDGPRPAAEPPPHEGPGHLPPGSRNMKLVSKLRLTDIDGGIADVAAFGKFAYLNKFSPECVSNAAPGPASR